MVDKLGQERIASGMEGGQQAVDGGQVVPVLFQRDALVEYDAFPYPFKGERVAQGYGVDDALCRVVLAGDESLFGSLVQVFGTGVAVA